jgi:hypothetical protein
MAPEIDAIPRADIDTQFSDSFAYRFAVTEIAGFQTAQAHTYRRGRCSISQSIQPNSKRLASIVCLVSVDYRHKSIVTLKIQIGNGGGFGEGVIRYR